MGCIYFVGTENASRGNHTDRKFALFHYTCLNRGGLGTQYDFFIDIEGISKLPDSVIPSKIREYVVANYPQNHIIGWEIDGRNQQVELDNDLDLEFTMNGDFIRIDS